MLEFYGGRARQVVAASYGQARQLGASEIGSEHLLLALSEDQASAGGRILQLLDVSSGAIREMLASAPRIAVPPRHASWSAQARACLRRATRMALSGGADEVDTLWLLAAAIESDTTVKLAGTSRQRLGEAVRDAITRGEADPPTSAVIETRSFAHETASVSGAVLPSRVDDSTAGDLRQRCDHMGLLEQISERLGAIEHRLGELLRRQRWHDKWLI